MDHLDTQTNQFLENGTRGNVITARSFDTDFDRVMGSDMAPCGRPAINMDSWEQTTPITSLFDVLPPVPADSVAAEGRPMTKREVVIAAKKNRENTYKMIEAIVGGEV